MTDASILDRLTKEIDRASMLNETHLERVPVDLLKAAQDRLEGLEADNARLTTAGFKLLNRIETLEIEIDRLRRDCRKADVEWSDWSAKAALHEVGK